MIDGDMVHMRILEIIRKDATAWSLVCRDGLRLDAPPERDSPTDATDVWCERGFSDTWDGVVKEFGDEATASAWAALEAYEGVFYGENDDHSDKEEQ